MAKGNRRNGSRGSRLILIRGGVLGALALGLLVFYLGLSNRCEDLGRQIKQAEQEKEELQKKVSTEEHNWAQARSIRNMEKLMTEHGLAMSWPAESQIIRLRVMGGGAVTEYARHTPPSR